MSERDYTAYMERLAMLAGKHPVHVMLGGHTHQAGQTKDGFCYHGPRFYFPGQTPTLYFGRIILKPGTENSWIPERYEFYPRCQAIQPLDPPDPNVFTQPK